jgi:hypothetical protein
MHSYAGRILSNRLRTYPKDRINYYSLDYPVYFNNEEGA